jgi:hypothetical protein
MSETHDRTFQVTYLNSGKISGTETVIAAYWQREGGRYVFKRADGLQVFEAAEEIVATVRLVEDAAVSA